MSIEKAYCPALLITAPSSDSGKTTIVAAMARYWRNKGKRVRVFKTGPDFIDPIFHEFATGEPAYQLDLGMMGEEACKQHLYLAAQQADLILIEGVMGMYDGANSSANLAARFGVPLLAIIPAAKMAQTFGAIAYGLAHYQDNVNLFGVIANYVGSPGHAKMLQASLPDGIEFCGAMPRDSRIALPERHLGLVQAQEMESVEEWLEYAAKVLGESVDLPLPEPICFEAAIETVADAPAVINKLLSGQTIAVARDAAFSFLYRDNLSLLESLGAKLCFFSPINDTELPQADSLYLPGGYPELHLEALSQNTAMLSDIAAHIQDGKPALAECGGMLYLLAGLSDRQGKEVKLVAALPGEATMESKLQGLGMLTADIGTQSLRGHCFHYSKADIALTPICTASQAGSIRMPEAVYLHHNTLASYVHWYLPSNPTLASDIFLGKLARAVEQA
ncbi:cobyrinate a,c-diamide synthase [Shewanella benthica]|uniref:Cobyrinic acid a,c-diamide synthase n=1 Tax=Shewanella benthica KT99 TaxID=314608 RepID=A9D388_9GAMM|nr:cobyrinate a,c-diamide synthase [Shewanella benthica]EDQ01632.1 cobyrinic acid a,c-diamide synthase [Shewanella benthica KT99]